MKKILLVLLLNSFTSLLFAQKETDSLMIQYEMEPVHFTEKKGEFTFSVLNYFSKRQNIGVKFNGLYPLAIMEPFINSYGLKLNMPSKDNYFFIKSIDFLAHWVDTLMLESDKYFILVKSKDGKIIKHELKYQNFIYHNTEKKDDNSILMNLNFELKEIEFKNNDEVYFFREQSLEKKDWIRVYLINQRKSSIYQYTNGKVIPVRLNFTDAGFAIKNPMWQVRIKYHSYKKES